MHADTQHAQHRIILPLSVAALTLPRSVLPHRTPVYRRCISAAAGVEPDRGGCVTPLEAALNARLHEQWECGKAWARLDLYGVEWPDREGGGAGTDADFLALLPPLDDGVAAQLEEEWEQLRMHRQRYTVCQVGGCGVEGLHA